MYVACQNGGAAPARVVTLGAPRREGARGKRRARAGETHVRATTRAAAKAAGRPSPRESSKFVICSLPLFSSLPSSLGSLSLFFTTLAHVTMAAVESDADWRKILEQRGVAPPSAGPHRCESGTEADEMGNFVCGIFVLLFAVGVGGSAANGRGEGERPTEADSEGRVTDNSREKERNERHSTLKENLRLGHDHTHKQTYNTHTHTHTAYTQARNTAEPYQRQQLQRSLPLSPSQTPLSTQPRPPTVSTAEDSGSSLSQGCATLDMAGAVALLEALFSRAQSDLSYVACRIEQEFAEEYSTAGCAKVRRSACSQKHAQRGCLLRPSTRTHTDTTSLPRHHRRPHCPPFFSAQPAAAVAPPVGDEDAHRDAHGKKQRHWQQEAGEAAEAAPRRRRCNSGGAHTSDSITAAPP